MNKRIDFAEAKEVFERGDNVIEHFRNQQIDPDDLQDVILYSYDLQAGTYCRLMEDPQRSRFKEEQGRGIAELIDGLEINSLCDAGVGEGTTLRYVLDHVSLPHVTGFDLSLSRLPFAREFLGEHQFEVPLFAADFSGIRLPDNAVDAVLTVHSLEPNGGLERELLRELHRVTARYLILIEPDYKRAGTEQRERMRTNGYVRDLDDRLAELDGRTLRYEPWLSR